MAISFFYDPMIAKMICHASTREAAIEKTIRAIDDYQITGVETTLGFCRFVMEHPAFRSGKFDTKFVEQHFKPEYLQTKKEDNDQDTIAAALAATVFSQRAVAAKATSNGTSTNKWKQNRLR